MSSTTVDDGPEESSIFEGHSDEYEFAFELGGDDDGDVEESGPPTSAVSVYGDRWTDDLDEDELEVEEFDDELDEVEEYENPIIGPAQAGELVRPRYTPISRLSRREKRRRVKLQARRVRRVVRHVEPWSVFKISVFFYVCLWFVFLVAGLILWSFATSSGTVENVENLVEELFALDSFTFDSAQIFRGFALAGVVLMIGGTIFNVMVCVLFNLLSDLTGGLRITMIEEETVRPMPPPRRNRGRARKRRRRPPPPRAPRPPARA